MKRLAQFSPLGLVGFFICVFWLLVALAAPWIAPHDPITTDTHAVFLPPSSGHWMGTDKLGRDVLSRVILGSRTSLPAGVLVVFVASAVGVIVGTIAGYTGGWLDNVLMRVADMVLAFPSIILAMAIAAALGSSLTNSLVAMLAVWWPQYARLARGMVLSAKQNEYVVAARALGCTEGRVLRTAIIPQCIGSILVVATTDLGNAILVFSGLSFLGLGVSPPTPEWGAMVAEGAENFVNWWVGTFPGLCILSLALGFNFVGDAIRDYLDPRLRVHVR